MELREQRVVPRVLVKCWHEWVANDLSVFLVFERYDDNVIERWYRCGRLRVRRRSGR